MPMDHWHKEFANRATAPILADCCQRIADSFPITSSRVSTTDRMHLILYHCLGSKSRNQEKWECEGEIAGFSRTSRSGEVPQNGSTDQYAEMRWHAKALGLQP